MVEYITDVTLLPEPGKFVCGQAAMMSGFGLELTELGIEVWAPSSRPCENLLSFAGMNRLCAAASGIGTALLDLATVLRPDGFGLWVFETNVAARRFYAARGLVEVERTDGADNEERAPDVHLRWTP